MRPVICPYCNAPARLVTGEVIYPHRFDLFAKRFWSCGPCNAYVGTHAKSGEPLGTLANAETRSARMKAHAAFDPLWKSGAMTRTKAYQWLSKATGIPKATCHISMMNPDQCRKVVAAVAESNVAHGVECEGE
jgi:zinc-finger-containing domain